MTKKHFIALADAMRELKPSIQSAEQYADSPYLQGAFEQWTATVDKVESFCRANSPAFDAAKWKAYVAGKCGPNGGGKV